MSTAHVISLLIVYKYYILFPIAFFEGHIISLVAGFLSSLGYFNPVFAWAIIVLANLLGDVILYWIGYHWGERAVLRIGKFFGITEGAIEKSKVIFHKYRGRILFISKLSNGFGFAMAVLFTAGMVAIPFGEFMAWNALGESIWSALLVTLGFVFGHLYTTIANVLFKIGLFTFAAALIFIFVRARRRLFKKMNGT